MATTRSAVRRRARTWRPGARRGPRSGAVSPRLTGVTRRGGGACSAGVTRRGMRSTSRRRARSALKIVVSNVRQRPWHARSCRCPGRPGRQPPVPSAGETPMAPADNTLRQLHHTQWREATPTRCGRLPQVRRSQPLTTCGARGHRGMEDALAAREARSTAVSIQSRRHRCSHRGRTQLHSLIV